MVVKLARNGILEGLSPFSESSNWDLRAYHCSDTPYKPDEQWLMPRGDRCSLQEKRTLEDVHILIVICVAGMTSGYILLLDMAPCHLHHSVLANSLNVWLCCVPARLTPVLQPLHVACFSACAFQASRRTAQ